MSKFLSKVLLTLVSSTSIKSTSLRVWIALIVMSPRFPIGVGTKYSIFRQKLFGKYKFL